MCAVKRHWMFPEVPGLDLDLEKAVEKAAVNSFVITRISVANGVFYFFAYVFESKGKRRDYFRESKGC